MVRFAEKYRSESTRLRNWNYSTPGIYFITICTLNHGNFFGRIIDNKMVYSLRGQIALDCLTDIPKHFADVCLTAFVVMPNHLPILFHVETPDLASLQDNRPITLIKYDHQNHPNYYPRMSQKSKQLIPKIVQQYKSTIKRVCKQQNIFFGWQSRYYDEIVHDQQRLSIIRQYIQNNVINWQKDKLYTT